MATQCMQLIPLSVAFVILTCSGCTKSHDVEYLFHYKLSDEEISELPEDVATLAIAIRLRKIESIPTADRELLFLRCPRREKGETRERMVWGLDGKRPNEGDRCIWVDVNLRGEVLACGFVRIG